MTGVKGRKTKYQTFDTSQLFVYAKTHLDEGVPTTATDIVSLNMGDHPKSAQPTVLKLDDVDQDNVLLETMRMSEDTSEELKTVTKLSVMGQVCVCGGGDGQIILQCLCIDIKNNNPKYGLITEQIGSYINRIIVDLTQLFHN